MKHLIGLLFLSFSATALAAGEAERVLECMRANVPVSARLQDVELTVTDRSGGSRSLKGKLYGQREAARGDKPALVRATLRIDQPINLSGAAVLVREASQIADQGVYVYLPSVRRVRRITGEFADGALLGTDFTYNDLRLMQNAFGEQRPAMEAAESIDGRATHVLRFAPKDPSQAGYSKVRVWVDKTSCVPLKAEFYQGENLRKRLTTPNSALKKSGDYWYAAEYDMDNFLAGSKSRLSIGKVSSDPKLPKRIFEPRQFHLGG